MPTPPNVANWQQAGAMIAQAIEPWGRVDALVCNAGFRRDRMLAGGSEIEWDSVTRVHFKGHFAPARHAIDRWRQRAKAGMRSRGTTRLRWCPRLVSDDRDITGRLFECTGGRLNVCDGWQHGPVRSVGSRMMTADEAGRLVHESVDAAPAPAPAFGTQN